MTYPSIYVEDIDDEQVMVIKVVESKQKPVLVFSNTTALNDLNRLVDKGIIVAKGEKRYRCYILQ
ncbi:hypothetical protein M1O17_00375 [Dehalococcoidia bacterium]|nr:hypothetical protein [Dehalococcoidia bacterium]MCL0102425.1 hypothetical protein [Dehalococcoidia bacterium]